MSKASGKDIVLPPDYYNNPDSFRIVKGIYVPAFYILKTALKRRLGEPVIDHLGPRPTSDVSIVAPTHRSWLDIPYTAIAADHYGIKPLRFVFKSEYYKPKILGWGFKNLVGGVGVNRGEADTEGMFSVLEPAMEQGHSPAIFPEGRRQKDIDDDPREVAPEIKSGAARLSVRTGIPLRPLAIAGIAPVELQAEDATQPIVAVFGEAITGSDYKAVQSQLHEGLQAALDMAYQIRDAS